MKVWIITWDGGGGLSESVKLSHPDSIGVVGLFFTPMLWT